MVVFELGKHHFFIDGYLKSNLDALIKNVKKKYDAFIVITGKEGYGKSSLAAQIALYCDNTFSLDRCCFTDEQFAEATEKAEKFQAVVFDETMGYLSSRGAMSKFNRRLIKIMSEMRSKQLFVILCIPNFFELDRYPAIHRTTGLIHIYKRSFFGSYDYPTKKKLYLMGKRIYSYTTPPNFRGRFAKYFVYDEEEYEKKKQAAISQWTEEKKENTSVTLMQRNILISECHKRGMDKEEIAEKIELSPLSIAKILRKIG